MRRRTSTAGSGRCTNQCRGTSRHRRDACSTAADSLIDAHRFRRVYQHFGSPKGYEVLPDAAVFLDKISDSYLLGICSNTPNRHSASVLPMLGIHERFKFFARDAASRSRPSPSTRYPRAGARRTSAARSRIQKSSRTPSGKLGFGCPIWSATRSYMWATRSRVIFAGRGRSGFRR